jgi:hypothetical protein
MFRQRSHSSLLASYVLGRIMSGAATEDVVTEIHEYLTNINTDLRDGKIDLDDLIVYKVGAFDSTCRPKRPPHDGTFISNASVLERTRRTTQTKSRNPTFKWPCE